MTDDDDDFERVDRLMALAQRLTPTRDWSALLVEAGLEPSDVVMTVGRRRLRSAAAVRAEHPASGSACEAAGDVTVEENAAAAIAGLAGLLFDQDD